MARILSLDVADLAGISYRQLDEQEILADLSRRVRVNGECWEWVGDTVAGGYGRCFRNGRNNLVHRYALSLFLGRPLVGLALHTCDNPPCFRPSHLYEGTQADNMRDRSARGRTATGETHGKSKLTPEQVVELRADRDTGMSHRALGRKYGISYQAVRDIVRRKNWRSV